LTKIFFYQIYFRENFKECKFWLSLKSLSFFYQDLIFFLAVDDIGIDDKLLANINRIEIKAGIKFFSQYFYKIVQSFFSFRNESLIPCIGYHFIQKRKPYLLCQSLLAVKSIFERLKHIKELLNEKDLILQKILSTSFFLEYTPK